jgi:signal transduction histidine kinase/ActR/RegA family two-component response regulator
MDDDELARLQRRLERERLARKEAERLLEDKARELHLANRKLLLTLDSLEKTVQDRTHELRQALERAEAANRAKNLFLATVSHEIRTPMHGILGMAEVLQHTPLNEEQQQHLCTLQSSANGLLALINDLLDFAKMEAGRLEMVREPFILNEVISGVLQLFLPTSQQKGILLSSKLDLQPRLEVLGDAVRLRQILLNLVVNALKFTEHGKVCIKASVTYQSSLHLGLRIEVSDTGIGIAPELKARLFKPFVQADSSTSRRYGGTGLGLAICQQIVQLFGGEIGCDSTEGEGSLFWFEIPLSLPQPHGSSTTTVTPVQPAKVNNRSLTVLVADDNPVNQQVAMLLLSVLGHKVSIANNGEEAVAAVMIQPFDLVLMDLHMPNMDGFEATQAIRSKGGAVARVPIIALTADTVQGIEERCLQSGMNGFVTKPFTKEKIQQMLTSLAAERQPRAPTEA